MKIVITGGHTGIGLELSNKLLTEGHELALIVRNKGRAEETLKQLAVPEKVTFFYADLAVQTDVLQLAKDIKAHWETIDGLFNNAGVLLDKNYYSAQNNEMHLEVNVLAPWLLTKELAEHLEKATAPFVVNTGTGGMHNHKRLELAYLIKPTKFVKLMGAYYQSKLAMMLVMNQLSMEMNKTRVLTVDPGALKTKMTANADAIPFFIKLIRGFLFQPPIKGAEKLYNGAFAETLAKKSGVYVSQNKVKTIKLTASDSEIARLLSGIA